MQETQETRVRSLGQEDPLEKGMATHTRILVWQIPWTEEPCGLWSRGLQRVRHNCSDWAQHIHTCICNKNLHNLLYAICIKIREECIFTSIWSDRTKSRRFWVHIAKKCQSWSSGHLLQAPPLSFHSTQEVSTGCFILIQFWSPCQVLNRPNPSYF